MTEPPTGFTPQRLRAARASRRMSTRELAVDVGMTATAVAAILAGTREPRAVQLGRLARAVGLGDALELCDLSAVGGLQLVHLRAQTGLSPAAAAERLEWTLADFRQWETTGRFTPRLDVSTPSYKLATLYRVTPDALEAVRRRTGETHARAYAAPEATKGH